MGRDGLQGGPRGAATPTHKATEGPPARHLPFSPRPPRLPPPPHHTHTSAPPLTRPLGLSAPQPPSPAPFPAPFPAPAPAPHLPAPYLPTCMTTISSAMPLISTRPCAGAAAEGRRGEGLVLYVCACAYVCVCARARMHTDVCKVSLLSPPRQPQPHAPACMHARVACLREGGWVLRRCG